MWLWFLYLYKFPLVIKYLSHRKLWHNEDRLKLVADDVAAGQLSFVQLYLLRVPSRLYLYSLL